MRFRSSIGLDFGRPALCLALLLGPLAGTALQAAAGPAKGSLAAPIAPTEPSNAVKPSELLQRSLDELHTTLTGLRLEKWKAGTVRLEAAANIASIQKDLETTLPTLLAACDAAPASVSAALPVSRNVDALYDVLLRVVDGARVSAPGEQAAQLAEAMANVEKSRLALNDRLQEMAASQEKQIVDLRGAVVKAQAQPAAAPACPAVPAAIPAPAPAAKKKAVVKKKPAATPPAGQGQPAASKPDQQ